MAPQEKVLGCSPHDHPFLSSAAPTPLRVTCYGSSSSQTPDSFLQEAYNLGKALALRGHTCVNGAGAYGCMAAMNDGAAEHNGHIVGVIHEMFIVDGSDWAEDRVRDGGAHKAFHGGKRQMLVARGEDLQERKKMLVEGADALVVLPGGPGTWDELLEMACARNIGLTDLPIVCVNVHGYYDPLRELLLNSAQHSLMKLHPDELIRFENTAIEAVQWLESQVEEKRSKTLSQTSDNMPYLKRRTDSFMKSRGTVVGGAFTSMFEGSAEWLGGILRGGREQKRFAEGLETSYHSTERIHVAVTFAFGVAVGVGLALKLTSPKAVKKY